MVTHPPRDVLFHCIACHACLACPCWPLLALHSLPCLTCLPLLDVPCLRCLPCLDCLACHACLACWPCLPAGRAGLARLARLAYVCVLACLPSCLPPFLLALPCLAHAPENGSHLCVCHRGSFCYLRYVLGWLPLVGYTAQTSKDSERTHNVLWSLRWNHYLGSLCCLRLLRHDSNSNQTRCPTETSTKYALIPTALYVGRP